MKNRIIRVTGRGQLRLRPDTARLTLTVSSLCAEYGEALERSAADTRALRDTLRPLGFGDDELKTLSFGVDPEYESVQDEQGRWTQKFSGYRFRHVLKLEFPRDNERLGRLLYALGHSPVSPEFQISYTVKDAEKAKNELLALAVADAQEKAAALTKAAGTALGELLSIDYSWGEISFETRPMNRMLAAECQADASAKMAYDVNIEPDDIDSSDTVTMVWRIS